MKQKEPEYLGDAVYAQVSKGGVLLLTTATHDPQNAHDLVYLEDEVLEKLLKYVGKE